MIKSKKFPGAQIHFQVNRQSRLLLMLPLLLLPLIENAFNYGTYHLENGAGVKAKLSVSDTLLHFHIEQKNCRNAQGVRGRVASAK
ncbi:hypothetical protein [Pedobacter agri]|uniref:hypothetical protein n=1 Tax=Pedobacter agri TaxID=454586 RepID=UPI00292EEBF8|nr:hypothetical protein [Pedobacter agri]